MHDLPSIIMLLYIPVLTDGDVPLGDDGTDVPPGGGGTDVKFQWWTSSSLLLSAVLMMAALM